MRKDAMGRNKTSINCLECSNADHYTTIDDEYLIIGACVACATLSGLCVFVLPRYAHECRRLDGGGGCIPLACKPKGRHLFKKGWSWFCVFPL